MRSLGSTLLELDTNTDSFVASRSHAAFGSDYGIAIGNGKVYQALSGGALRTRASIASFFNGAATDLGLVRGGILVATGETLPQVRERVLGGANSGSLYTSTAGFAVFGLRGGVRLTPRIDITLLGDNLLDRSHRLHGSGLDASGAGLQARLRFHF